MKVSVSLVTYNQEKFIVRAIESVLVQKTNFDFEIVIGEDESEDNTRAIVIDYKNRYPDQINVILNSRDDVIYINGKPTGRWNFINNLKNVRGQYIALLEGDDYWTSPYKLQKQVDFLDNHPECSMCFHDVEVVSEEGELISVQSPRKKKQRYTLKDLLRGNFIHTCSVMYRRGLFKEFPDWFYKTPLADWPLHILNAQHGDIGYISEVMGAYRIHGGGIHSSKSEMEQVRGMIEIYPYINAHLDYRYNTFIKSRIWFKLIEKRMGLFLASHGLERFVRLYRKIFYE
jgi:glycosyltransferase involved in cell wall biosynthesis